MATRLNCKAFYTWIVSKLPELGPICCYNSSCILKVPEQPTNSAQSGSGTGSCATCVGYAGTYFEGK